MRQKLFRALGLIVIVTMSIGVASLVEALPPCCQKEKVEQSRPTGKSQTYSQLEITSVTSKEGKIVIRGASDLPNGARLLVFITEEGTDPLKLKRQCEVMEGKFSVFVTPPQEWSGTPRTFTVKVVFDPRMQSLAIGSRVGNRGQNLRGEKVNSWRKSNSLETEYSTTLEF